MVDYGDFNIVLDDIVNEAFAEFAYDQDASVGVEELFCMLIGYGLVELGYLDLSELPEEERDDQIENNMLVTATLPETSASRKDISHM